MPTSKIRSPPPCNTSRKSNVVVATAPISVEKGECPLRHEETALGSGVCVEGHTVPRRSDGCAIFREGYAPRIALATRATRKGDLRRPVTAQDCVDAMVQCVTKEARDAWHIYLREKRCRRRSRSRWEKADAELDLRN